MKKIRIIIYLSLLFIVAGCKKEVDSTTNLSQNDKSSKEIMTSSSKQKVTTNTTEESKNETGRNDIQQIPSSDFSDVIKKLNKAVILVGNSKNSSYQEVSGELSKACEEMDVEFYQTDLTDEEGQKIKEQYKFGDTYDILVVIDGKIQRIEIGGGDSLNADILQKVFTMYGL